MHNKTRVILSPKLWDNAKTKAELKKNIGAYMSKSYPNYTVIEVGKYYAICQMR